MYTDNHVSTKKEMIYYISSHFDSSDYVRDEFYRLFSLFGEKEVYHFFSDLYDDMYFDITSKKISVSLETRKILELLALPLHEYPQDKKQTMYKKL